MAVTPLEPAEPVEVPDLGEPAAFLAAVEAEAGRLEEAFAGFAPDGAVGAEDLSEVHYHYYAGQDLLRRVRAAHRRLADRLVHPAGAPRTRRRAMGRPLMRDEEGRWRDLLALPEIRTGLREIAARVVPAAGAAGEVAHGLADLARDLARLQALARRGPTGETDLRVELRSPPDAGSRDRRWLRDLYLEVCPLLELDAEPEGEGLRVRGALAEELLGREEGIHLFCPPRGALVPVTVRVDAGLPRVVRVYEPQGVTVDLRTGWAVPGLPGAEEMRGLLQAALPLELGR